MAKKQKAPESKPSNAYLISFGDTMTALLAFFIVMNSLAEEQTGANMYAGTGSFANALSSGGLPGSFSTKSSKHTFQRSEASPLYVVNDEADETAVGKGTGPDDVAPSERIIDREQESLQRFLIEMEQMSKVTPQKKTSGQMVFDMFESIDKKSPHVSETAAGVFRTATRYVKRPEYRMEIVVWATMPSKKAWKRATLEASMVRDDLIKRNSIPASLRPRIRATGKPWLFSDEKRPRFSFIVEKLER